MAGSTAGGIKIVRTIVVIKYIKAEINEIIEYIVIFVWVVGLAYLIMMQSFNISTNILLYFVISTPVILIWERKVGLLQELYKMYK